VGFKAFLIEQNEGKISSRFVEMEEGRLDAGEVTIAVAWSGVNYKDALAAAGAGRIVRRFPCIGGIDMAGTVVKSDSPDFKPGDAVLATSYDVGVAHHGGYAEREIAFAELPGVFDDFLQAHVKGRVIVRIENR